MNCPVTVALQQLAQDRPVILRDDGSPDSRAYIICLASRIGDAQLALMLNAARGVIIAAINEHRLAELQLAPMVAHRSDGAPELMTSVEAREGTRTGISARDRATTLRALATGGSSDLISPGHIFPWRAQNGGVLVRAGVVEAAVDLALACSEPPVAAICQMLNGAGEVGTTVEVDEQAKRLECPIVTLSQLISFRLDREQVVTQIADAQLPTKRAGDFRALGFRSLIDSTEHLALVKGDISGSEDHPVLARVHSGNRLTDLLVRSANTGNDMIARALAAIDQEGRGVFVYVRRPKVWEDDGAAPKPHVMHEFGTGAQILRALGVKRLRLLSASERSFHALQAFSLSIEERVPF